jgi:hypothetical protein
MTRTHRLTTIVLALATCLSACASLPPAQPATGLGRIAGKWEGTVTTGSGARLPFTSTIGDDGAIETLIPALTNPGPRFVGTVRVDSGVYRWKSETTGRTGTYTLHEGEGRRVLIGRADDGRSYSEATPAR